MGKMKAFLDKQAAEFDKYDVIFGTSDFDGNVIEPARFSKGDAAEPIAAGTTLGPAGTNWQDAEPTKIASWNEINLAAQPVSGDDPEKVQSPKKRKRSGKKPVHSGSSDQVEIDLSDPSRIAEALARVRSLNSGIHMIAARKVKLEERCTKLEQALEASERRYENLEGELTDVYDELEHTKEMLKFAADTGIVGFKRLARRFLEGVFAAIGLTVILVYLFF